MQLERFTSKGYKTRKLIPRNDGRNWRNVGYDQ
jgi:hypothetical protein